jgi:predicted dienelactone hydrolase
MKRSISFRSREERIMDRKTFWFLSLFLISLMGSSVTATAAVHQGSFAVGHSVRRLNVPGTLGGNRPVDVHLWYPARSPDDCDNSDNSDGNRDDQGCSVTPSEYMSRLYGIPLLPQWDPLSWTIGSSESFENLPIARGHRPFPVIIFSHGHQNNAIGYVYTLEALASFGFIVAAPDHLNGTQDDVRIDFINSKAQLTLIPCFDGLPSPCAHPDVNLPDGTVDVSESMTDRAHDISAVIDALPTWFEDRVDLSRVGVMGHSRGTVTALVAAGGSATWKLDPDPRVKAIMGLAIGVSAITFGANVQDVTVPARLVAGKSDSTLPVSEAAFDILASTEKEIVLIENANHRHFDSGLCAQTQSSGSIAAASTRAILDLQTLRGLVIALPGRRAMDFCRFEAFTDPDDNIRPLVFALTGFDVTPTNVPTTGLDSSEVKETVTELAVAFFGHVFSETETKGGQK